MKLSKEEMNLWVEGYIEAQEKYKKSGEDNHWSIEKFFDLDFDHPQLCWEAILQILHRKPSQKVLGVLAAGPLEDLIHHHGPSFINEIEKEAKINTEFKDLLGGVWESSTDEVWNRVLKARGNKSW